MRFDKKMKRISTRNWENLKELWLPHLPVVSPAGLSPRARLIETSGLKITLDQVARDGEYRTKVEELYKPFFWHAMFFLQKGSHVLTAAERHLDSGHISWASNSAYHSALFSAQAILGVLGVYTAQYRNPYYIVDLFPGPEKGNRKKKFQRGSSMQFMYVGKMDQRHWWQLFQEVVDKAEVQVWEDAFVNFFTGLDESDFAIQRNCLIYRDFGWGCGDLMRPNLCPHDVNGWSSISGDSMSVGRCDFSVSMAVLLLNMGLRLLGDFRDLTPVLEPEIAEIKNQMGKFGAPRALRFLTSQGSV